MNKNIFLISLLAGSALPVGAATFITSYGTVSGADDANQAGPMFGQGITVTAGADTADGSIPATVYLSSISFQRSSSTTGVNTASVAYIHVYDAFAVDGDNTPSTIGNLVAVSTNTVDFSTIGSLGTMTWSFSGSNSISKSSAYYYVLASNTTAATVANSSNLLTQGFELNTGNPYTGGQAFRANGTTSDWDLEFSLTTNTIPEPGVALLGGLGLLGLLRRRR